MDYLDKLEKAEFKNESLKNQLREVIKAMPEYTQRKSQVVMIQIVYAMTNVFKEDSRTVTAIFNPPRITKDEGAGVRLQPRRTPPKQKEPLNIGDKPCEDCPKEKDGGLSDAKSAEDIAAYFMKGADKKKAAANMREALKAYGVKYSNSMSVEVLSKKLFNYLNDANR